MLSIKKNWKILLIALIGLTNAFLTFAIYMKWLTSAATVAIINLVLAVSYPIIEALEKISEKKEVVEAKVQGWDDQVKDINVIKTDVKAVKDSLLEQKVIIEEKKKENRIIVDLINKGLISVNTIENNILDKRFVSVLCYQAGFSVRNNIISEKVNEKIKNLINEKKNLVDEGIDLHREYRKIFEEMGFIKLAGKNEFFIIPEDNLPPKLRELNYLSNYLIKEGTLIVDYEWNKIKEIHKKLDPDHYNKIKGIPNPINFNILITRINRRDMRNKFVLRNDFNKAFSLELSSIVNIHKFKARESEKVEIKNLVSQSSVEILIMSVNQVDRKKILALESIFKLPISQGGLEINNFYDYHNHNIKEIKKILLLKFPNSKAEEYAKIIHTNSYDYKDNLIQLGIKI